MKSLVEKDNDLSSKFGPLQDALDSSQDFHSKESISQAMIGAFVEKTIIGVQKDRTRIMWMFITYQIWEQSLISWIDFLIDAHGKDKAYPVDLQDVRLFLNPNGQGINIKRFQSWNKIIELQKIVNVIKHGEGEAEEWLRKKKPELFRRDSNGIDGLETGEDILRNSHKTIIGSPLKLTDSMMEEYTTVLIDFWNELFQVTNTIKLPYDRAGINTTLSSPLAFEKEAVYYIRHHINSAKISISKILDHDPFCDEFHDKIQYYHYYCDHLLFSIGQIGTRFIETRGNNPKKREMIQINRKNFGFKESVYKNLSNKEARNVIAHIDERGISIIEKFGGVGGFNVIFPNAKEEIKNLKNRRETHLYTLDLIENKILLYNTNNKKQIEIVLDDLQEELDLLLEKAEQVDKSMSMEMVLLMR